MAEEMKAHVGECMGVSSAIDSLAERVVFVCEWWKRQ